MFRRRPLLRAAAVGGGAYLAGKRHARRSAEQQEQEAYQDARISDLEQQQAPQGQAQQAQAPQAQAASPMIDQLNQLAALRQQGVLTDAEFSAAKAKLFGTPAADG
jgi:membrane protease subunit (stomatin/prohibitin family)